MLEFDGRMIKRYCGGYIAEYDGRMIKQYCGGYLYEINGFLDHKQLMALFAILFA